MPGPPESAQLRMHPYSVFGLEACCAYSSRRQAKAPRVPSKTFTHVPVPKHGRQAGGQGEGEVQIEREERKGEKRDVRKGREISGGQDAHKPHKLVLSCA